MDAIQEVSPDPDVVLVPQHLDGGTVDMCPPEINQQPVDCLEPACAVQASTSAQDNFVSITAQATASGKGKFESIKKKKVAVHKRAPRNILKVIEKYKYVSRPRQLTKMVKDFWNRDRKSVEKLMFKLKAIECVDNGTCKDFSALAKNGLTIQDLSRFMQNRNMHETAAEKDWRLEDFRNYSNYEVERRLVEYIISCQEAGIPYTRQDMKEQAVAIANTLKMKKFIGTDFWLQLLSKRIGFWYVGEGNNLKIIDPKAAAKKFGLEKELLEPEEDPVVENEIDTPLPDNYEPFDISFLEAPQLDYEPPQPLDGEEINEIVPKKKKKKEMPTVCRICSAKLVDAGGMRLRDFNVRKAKQWIKDFIGYEVAPVERPDGSDFPYGICWNCVNNFHNWVKKLGKDSEDYWTETETSIWTAYQCKADASTQTDKPPAIQVESVNTDTPFFSPENLLGSENSAPLLAGGEICDGDMDSETTLSASESSLIPDTCDPLDVKPDIARIVCNGANNSGTILKKSPQTTPVKKPGPLRRKSSGQNQIQRMELLCPLCNKMFTVWRQLLKHNRECQMKTFPLKADLVRCTMCQFASFNDSDMADHSCLQNGQTALSILHVCTLCKVGFKTSIEFWRHVCL